MSSTILVTGGAGYIGSHLVQLLGQMDASERPKVIVLDDLSKGFESAVTYGELVVGKVGDYELVSSLLQKHDIKTVIHFAAHTIVPESVENPLKYYGNNTCSTRNLLQACQDNGVKNFIFSSTAAVYGIPDAPECDEDTFKSPINPYGMSKLMSEMMLQDLGKATDLNFVILRYFNVAGSDPQGRIGQSTLNATLLTKVAVEAALGKREQLKVFGTDYDTHDGTGVRDYIHVVDLAQAHVDALKYLLAGGESQILNAGYGKGFSVREVISMVEKVHGQPLNVVEEDRRAGDPPILIAKCDKIKTVLNWVPKYNDLEIIVRSAYEWEKKLMAEQDS